jgi:hypothetical protein
VCCVGCTLAGMMPRARPPYEILQNNPNHKFMIEMLELLPQLKNMLMNPPPVAPPSGRGMTIFAPVDAVSTVALPTACRLVMSVLQHGCYAMLVDGMHQGASGGAQLLTSAAGAAGLHEVAEGAQHDL